VTHKAHKRWLKITALVIGSFGPVFSLGAMAPTREAARLTLDLLSWPIDGVTTYAHPDTRFLSALTGGFLFGWGVTVWCLSAWVYDRAPDAVRRTVLVGLCSWWCLDSAGSVASGNASNVLFNVLVLALAAGPLWWPAHEATGVAGRARSAATGVAGRTTSASPGSPPLPQGPLS
jgi:hypothetical protein